MESSDSSPKLSSPKGFHSVGSADRGRFGDLEINEVMNYLFVLQCLSEPLNGQVSSKARSLVLAVSLKTVSSFTCDSLEFYSKLIGNERERERNGREKSGGKWEGGCIDALSP